MWLTTRPDGDIHFGGYTTRYTKVCIYVRLYGRIAEIYLGEIAILLLGEIERELVVDGEIIVTGAFARIAVVVISDVTFLAVVSRKAFRAAETFSSLAIAMRRLVITFALLTLATVHGIAPVTRFALFAVGTVC